MKGKESFTSSSFSRSNTISQVKTAVEQSDVLNTIKDPPTAVDDQKETPAGTASWTRSQSVTIFAFLITCWTLTCAPWLMLVISNALEQHGGSLYLAASVPPWRVFSALLRFERQDALVLAGWLVFQALLYLYLPGPVVKGQITPSGKALLYNCNGLNAMFVTVAAWGILCYVGGIPGSWVSVHWPKLLVASQLYGTLMAIFVYIKAHVAPSEKANCKFSGSFIYDFVMGVELNPRILGVDLKFFHIGRWGMIGWLLIDLSNLAYDYEKQGHVTYPMAIVCLFNAIYVIDFFVHESWYLGTIDISHDHYGFYLAWGSCVWLPVIYPLQAQYLSRYPSNMSSPTCTMILVVGLASYVMFRWVNHEKDVFRRTNGRCTIWGKPPKYITAEYTTADGKRHASLLLTSGWWGIARHMNYTGDIILSWAMCAPCGSTHLLPWTYGIWMTAILVHRCWRDEERCKAKYGAAWDKYCAQVRWRLVPGLY